ncbi:hypothetical protein [Aliikangiella marina]|uniref:hypothetical protein n=1 Tax=Aliikangiella marina TaxID=1712262 RepID=UPI00163DAFEA|nr:hypothetical protein [Aliikangiella marina]
MIRLTYMSQKWIGTEIVSFDCDKENIDIFLDEGTPVLIVEDESDLPINLDYEII